MNLLDIPIDLLIHIYQYTSIHANGLSFFKADLLHTCKYLSLNISDDDHSLFRSHLNTFDIINEINYIHEIKHWNDETQLRCKHCSSLPRTDRKPCCEYFSPTEPL